MYIHTDFWAHLRGNFIYDIPELLLEQENLQVRIAVYICLICFNCRSICVNELLAPRIPVLKDLEEGLQHFNLLCCIKNHPQLFKQIFTPSSIYDVTPQMFIDSLDVIYSTQQMLKEKEEDTFKYFTDFVLLLGHEGTND